MRKDRPAISRSRTGGWRKARHWPLPLLLSLGYSVSLSSCSPNFYQTRADQETYTALFQKMPEVENVEPVDVDLAPAAPLDLSGLQNRASSADFLGEMGEYERNSKVLSLADALETGITYGRDYLSARERVFLSGLDLTLARHRLAPTFYTGGFGELATDSRDAAVQVGMTKLVSTNTFSRVQSTGFNWLYRTGARISTDFTQDFLRFLSGHRSLSDSDLAVTLIQPLLQGGGTTVTMERLTQEERNLLYDLRSFADFRRSFVVDLVSDYFGVLRARDRAHNNYVAYQGFLKNVEREEALAEEDRRTQTQLGKLSQAKFKAESQWIDAVRNYQSRLDEFKLTIGVPVDTKLILDDRELARLGIDDLTLTREESVKVALVTRPDLATAADVVDDAARRIKVAKNGLLPGLDIAVDYNSVSNPGDRTPALNWDRRRWSTSLDVDLPLDRKAERNIYRASMIDLDRAKRAKELADDRARLQVYDAWRALDQAKRNYQISGQAVDLAARRLEEQTLLAELGRGEARDLVDAQEDLVDAQNQKTSALVDHTLARLRLWRDMGILYISGDGSWVEKLEQEKPGPAL